MNDFDEAGSEGLTETGPVELTNDVQRLKKRAFLDAFAESGNITDSARKIGISRAAHYVWLADCTYRESFEDAKERFLERVEREIDRRAIEGWEEPVHYQGKRVDTVRKFSDTLLIFRAKALAPYKYRDNMSVEHSGPGGGPIPLAAIDAVIIGAKEQKQPLQIEAGTGEENAND